MDLFDFNELIKIIKSIKSETALCGQINRYEHVGTFFHSTESREFKRIRENDIEFVTMVSSNGAVSPGQRLYDI